VPDGVVAGATERFAAAARDGLADENISAILGYLRRT
jgi:hypothetical protein